MGTSAVQRDTFKQIYKTTSQDDDLRYGFIKGTKKCGWVDALYLEKSNDETSTDEAEDFDRRGPSILTGRIDESRAAATPSLRRAQPPRAHGPGTIFRIERDCTSCTAPAAVDLAF